VSGRYFAGTAAGFNTCCFPFIAVLVGSAFVPFMLITSDVCASVPDVSTQFVARSPDLVCGALGLDYQVIQGDNSCVVGCMCVGGRVEMKVFF
jgi:hypothetical protein